MAASPANYLAQHFMQLPLSGIPDYHNHRNNMDSFPPGPLFMACIASSPQNNYVKVQILYTYTNIQVVYKDYK